MNSTDVKAGDAFANRYGEAGTIQRIDERVVVIDLTVKVPNRTVGKIHYERFQFDWDLKQGAITVTPPSFERPACTMCAGTGQYVAGDEVKDCTFCKGYGREGGPDYRTEFLNGTIPY